MEVGNNNIEQLFKQKFDSFQPDVDPKVWNNIQKSIGKSGNGSGSFIGSLAGKLIIGSAAVAIFSVSTLMLLGKDGGSNSTKNTTSTKSPLTAQNNNIIKTEGKTDIKPPVTNVNPKTNSVVTNHPVVTNNNGSTENKLPVNINPTDNKPTNTSEGNKTETNNTTVHTDPQPEKKHITPPVQEDPTTVTNPDQTVISTTNSKIAKIEFTTSGSSTYAPLTVYFSNKGKAVTEEWSFGDGSFSRFEKNPVYLFEYPGEYTIILTATNEAGRVEKDSIKIKIKSNAFFIPNTFTPNGDGQNDSYKIIKNDNYPFEMTNLEIVIYDRVNGKMAAFNSVDYSWDGRSIKDGRMCPQGTYLVLIKYTSSEDGKSHEERGYLFLKD